MVERWKPAGEIKETLTLRVGKVGEGLALYLPKRLCQQYDIIGGDSVKVSLHLLFKRDYAAEEEEKDSRGKKHKRGELQDGELR